MTNNTSPYDTSALSALKPRQKPDVAALITEMRSAIQRAGGLEFTERMERNHHWRYCIWEGQDHSGRKVRVEGADPRKIFPWEGASDARVPLIDEIITERTDQLMVAYDLSEMRIGPRDFSPDEDRQNQAALWGGVADYYADVAAAPQRTAVHQWVDWAEEFGHSMLWIGWKEEQQLEKRSISAEDIVRITTAAALEAAEQNAAAAAEEQGAPPPEDGEGWLTEEDQMTVAMGVQTQVGGAIADPAQADRVMALLMQFDPDMSPGEARRVAVGLRAGGAAEYYAPYVSSSEPEWRALMPMVDVFYPPECRHAQDAPWIAMPEWVDVVQLRERVATQGYDKGWVDDVLNQNKGRAFDFGSMTLGSSAAPQWLVSGGLIGCGPAVTAGTPDESPLWQIIHLHYRATCLGGVPALYHTVLHPNVTESMGLHECCEEAHGRFPFRERVREQNAKTMMASRGVGEVSFSAQREIKIQRDMRADFSSLMLMPPMEVPTRQLGGRIDMRPGRQIPRVTTGGALGINWLKPPGDASGSEKVEADIMRSLNSYWARGAEADPETRLTRLRVRTAAFASDMKEVWRLTFQLIQQYSPDEIRASCVGGLPVDLAVSRHQIQGQISLGMTFDPADLDPENVLKKLKILNEALLPLDRTGALNTYKILRAAVSALLPAWTREIMPNTPEQTLRSEQEDEDRVLTQLLAGQEQPYIPGKDHKARLQVLLERMQAVNEDGSPTRIQRTARENPDVMALIQNRVKFHQAQLQQQQNANTGRIGVKPMQTAEPAPM